MIDYPFFRSLGSISVIEDYGSAIKAVLLSEKGGMLRLPARAVADQANKEASGKNIAHLFAAVVDRPLDHEVVIPFDPSNQLKGTLACRLSEDGLWEADDTKLIARRQGGPYLGVFVGPIDNKGVKACYQTMVDEGYPSENEPSPSSDLVAGAALRLISSQFREVKLEIDSLLMIPNVAKLQQAMSLLQKAYISVGNTEASWNVLWMLHMDRGLSNLQNAINGFKGEDLDAYIAEIVFPCFALPNPTDGIAYRSGHVYEKAIEVFWSNREKVALSIEGIVSKRNNQGFKNLLLGSIDWQDYDFTIHSRDTGGLGSSLLGFLKQSSNSPIFVEAFLDVSEEEFFNPTSGAPKYLEVRNLDGSLLPSHGYLENIEIIEKVTFEQLGGKRRLVSPELLVLLPVIEGIPDVNALNRSLISLEDLVTRNQDHVDVEILERLVWGKDRIAVRVRFSRIVRGATDFSYSPKVRIMRVVFPSGDSMDGLVSRHCQLKIMLLPPDGVGALVSDVRRTVTAQTVGQKEFTSDGIAVLDSDGYAFSVSAESELEVIIWSVVEPISLTFDGKDRDLDKNSWLRHKERIRIYSNQIVVEVDEVTLILDPIPLAESASETYQSPLRAATEKGSVDPEVREVDREDLRGNVETLIYRGWNSWGEVGRNNGHIVVSANRNEDLSTIKLDLNTRVLVSHEISGHGGLWPIRPGLSVETELVESDELLMFIKAFDSLRLIEAINQLGEEGGAQWISKLDLYKHLRRISDTKEDWRSLADAYLLAYVNLIKKADSVCDNFGKFWARYPFSLSIWDESPGRLSAVLLSPFHPLRFAWLANAEEVLNISSVVVEVRRMFAGTISGWQFPMISRSDTASGALMAVPTDNGIDSLFAGWSMLVSASVNVPTPLSIPRFAGNRNVPGVSASGLDASAIESAVSDFCNANPFVSTLVVDLASSSESPRTSTIDSSLIEKISRWSRQRVLAGQSPGGVRVYDSMNRLGEIPAEVLRISDAHVDTPPQLTWRKYNPDDLTPPANIRIMNDSDVSVEVETGNSVPRQGVAATNPLRRFEISRVYDGQVVSEIYPIIAPEATGPYINALVAAESRNSYAHEENAKIKLSIENDHAILSGADWTVVGESGLAPAALSTLLQIAGRRSSSSTLWEWKPPFFDGGRNSSYATVDRRPYLTVARIPNIFSQKLRGLVLNLLGDESTEVEVNEKIDRVIRTIGSRGVGLSSLIGGKQRHRTHQKGALGFSMVFDLIDAVSTSEETRFIIPLDAANQYLNVLAGRPQTDNGQRADLLAIEIQDNRVVFVPIEIKFYRLDNPRHILPDLTDNYVLDAVEQAVSSTRLLNDVRRFWSETRELPGDRELMDNAMVALIDAAIRLSPVQSIPIDLIRDRMQRLANGELEIEIGLPVVAYLVATNHAIKSRHAQLFKPNRSEILIADPRQVEADLRGGVQSGPISDWRNILRIAFLNSIEDVEILRQIEPKIESESQTKLEPQVLTKADVADVADVAAVAAVADVADVAETTRPKEDQEPSIDLGGKEPIIENDLSQNSEEPSLLEGPNSVGFIKDFGVKLNAGEFTDTKKEVNFWPGNRELSSLNVGVLGDMGTGKTQLCLGLVNQFRRLSRNVQDTPMTGLILDYKRDYQNPEFLAAVGGIVLKPRNLPLDVFGITGKKTVPEMNAKAMNFINIISMVFGGIGGQQRDRLREVIIQKISELDHSPTMQEVSEAYRLASKNKADSVTEILNNFVYGEVFSTDPNTFLNMEQLLAENVVVVDLRELDPDERTKKTLVAVFLSKYFEYMVKLPKWPVQPGKPPLRRLNSFLLVDEAVSIMEYHFDPLHQILLQGREYGVSVVLSSQYLSHFISSEANYAQPLRTWFIHRVPTVSKKSLNELGIVGATNDDANRIADLGIHHAFYASFDCPGRFIEGNAFFRQLEQMEESDRKW